MIKGIKMKNCSKINIKNVAKLLPIILSGVLLGCNSGNSASAASINDTSIQGGVPSNDFVSSVPPNCATDNMKNPSSATTEICVYTSSSQSGQTFSVTPPSFAKYASFYLAGGSGGGGGGGGQGWYDNGIGGLAGGSPNIYYTLNTNPENINIHVGGGGNGGGGGASPGGFDDGRPGAGGEYGSATQVMSNASSQVIISAGGGYGGAAGYGGDQSGPDYGPTSPSPSSNFINVNQLGTNPSYVLPAGSGGGGGSDAPNPGGSGTKGNSGFAIVVFSKNQFALSNYNFTIGSTFFRFALNINQSSSNNTEDYIIGSVNFENNQQIPGFRFVRTIGFPDSTLNMVTYLSEPYLTNPAEHKTFITPAFSDNNNCPSIRFEYKPVLQWQPFAQNIQRTVMGVGGVPVNFNYQYASTVVAADCRYDANDLSKYTTTSTIASPGGSCLLNNGNISCNSGLGNYNNGGIGFQLPNGNWVNECHGSIYDGVRLTANCQLGSNYVQTSANSQPGAYNASSSCEMSGRSLSCNTSDSYPSGNYGSYAPTWWNWNDQGDGTAKDIFLQIKGEYMTSLSIAAGGNSGNCSVVAGANGTGLLSCAPYTLPGGGWVNQSISALYDGYYLIAVDTNNIVHEKVVSPGSSCEYNRSAEAGLECN